MTETFYWYDYETWGRDPWRRRPCQFGGVRTDAELNPIGAPLVLFCRPTNELLPEPEACLTNGLTPHRYWNTARGAAECAVANHHFDGDSAAAPHQCHEAEFAARIRHELAWPGTCSVGFNARHFDDEVTRMLFYRNFYDPYAHAYQNGNSRWDLIDVMRLAHALRPDGLEWPQVDGRTSFKLVDLCQANAIVPTGRPHDALVDVHLTLALAKRLKTTQPKLFTYALTLRDKDVVNTFADKPAPFLHVSGSYPPEHGCIAPVLALGRLSENPNAAQVFDLRHDPAELADLSVADIRQRLIAHSQPPHLRIPIKQLRTNTVPMVAPLNTLTPAAAERWAIDRTLVELHAQRLQQLLPTVQLKLREAYAQSNTAAATAIDPELALYSGGFLPAIDTALFERLRAMTPEQLATHPFRFKDQRLPTLLFRYRARNWPESLNEIEREEWDAWRFEQFTAPVANDETAIDYYLAEIMRCRQQCGNDSTQSAILDALELWAEQVMDAGD
ncbi:exodeoxyribonuclease I [Rhodoferax sp. 4810]|uniref:Exodeoxyribonuclease I n=1 Tax=Thiospirillum jenense TaxID=1653858 RepID=A0A839HGS4_9GAMM|nr:exodeoxyribonuclease I [Thiospirillum jenense]MBB1077094.1 exodeoxyribonuclease I [Rhodoferax jenense]MBB1127170.1 exodeoxyribonuclease I [Thiospirillum jenense]